MTTARTIRIGGEAFTLVATINEGQTLYAFAGRSIGVEKMDMRPGATEFNFEVNSRATHGGRAIDMRAAATRSTASSWRIA